MNLSISSSLFKTFAIFLGVLGATAAIAIAGFARAEAGPVVGLNVRNTSNAVVTSAPAGSTLYASTTVASSTAGVTPTGTVNFSWWQSTSCTGIATVESAVALTGGSATSSTTIMPAAGLSYKVHYNGDATNTPSDSECVAVVPTSVSAAIGGTLSTSTALAGSSVFASAVLSGLAGNASGTVAYTAYTNNACTAGAMSAGSVSVSGGVVPNSNALTFAQAGTYYWQAVYSGDAQNNAATSTCGSMVLSILNPSTSTTTPPAAQTGSIAGVAFNDLDLDRAKDANEPGIAGITLSLRSGDKHDAVIATTTTDANGAYSFANLALGTYYLQELKQPGWKQTTPDAKVVLSSTSPARTLDFANSARTATSTGKDNDADDSDIDLHFHFTFGQFVSFLRQHIVHDNAPGSDANDHDNGKNKDKDNGHGKALGHDKHSSGDKNDHDNDD